MIEKDPNLPEAALLQTLKSSCIKARNWTAFENQKFLEAYELYGWDDSAISKHVGSKSTDQIRSKKNNLLMNMKSDPKMLMSHFLYTDPKANRQTVKWSESKK